ncbi:MAG: hypothetical protein QG599_2695 [Pseudomonadota bacterium]|nr:hypothetical protein [Pseudomonadota bacterium]
MLTQLQIENWKSFTTATLHFDPLSVLIGTNASGKSNVLDALQFLNRVASGTLITAALQGDSTMPPLRGGMEWVAKRPGNRFVVGVTVRSDDTTDYEYRLECQIVETHCDVLAEQLHRIKYRLDKKGGRKRLPGNGVRLYRTDQCEADAPTITARLYNEKQGSPRPLSRAHTVLYQLAGQPTRQEIKDGITVVVSALREIFILDPIPSHMRGFSPFSEKLEPDARNIAGVIAALAEAKQKEMETVLTQYASQLPERDIRRIYAEPVGKFKTDAMLYCEEHWLDTGDSPTVDAPGRSDDTDNQAATAQAEATPTIDARGMSDGTLRFLAILTALLMRPKGSLLVIEEVDNGLHPSRSRLLLDMLQKVGGQRGVDVLVTTHNPALLDAMGMELVPFITVAHRDQKTGDSVLTLLEEIEQLPKLLAQGPVGRLSSQGLIEGALKLPSPMLEAVAQ